MKTRGRHTGEAETRRGSLKAAGVAVSDWQRAHRQEVKEEALGRAVVASAAAGTIQGYGIKDVYVETLAGLPTVTLEAEVGNVCTWSDTHFGHRAILNYTGRPFDTRQEMDAALGEGWHTASEWPMVVHCGDVAFAKRGWWSRMPRMKGAHVVVCGNHDIEKDGESLIEGLGTVVAAAEMQLASGQVVWFTHMPMRRLPEGVLNVHGHTHQTGPDSPAHRNVSVEWTGYTVAPLAQVLDGEWHEREPHVDRWRMKERPRTGVVSSEDVP